jgi:hypothetical protein
MGPENIKPAWEYLREASLPTLQSFELSRLNHASNLRKEIDGLLTQWLDETAAALLARFLLDQAARSPHRTQPRQRRSLLAEPSTAGAACTLARRRIK